MRYRPPPIARTLVAVAAVALSACGSSKTTTPDGGPGDTAVDSVTPPSDGAGAADALPDAAALDALPDGAGAGADAERATVPTIEPTSTGGSRLVPRVWLTSDGDALPSVTARFDLGDLDGFIGQWFDTRLGVDCLFGVAEDGVLRCLPVDYAPVQEAYIDAACSVVGYAYTVVTPPHYRTSPIGPGGCVDQKYRVRRIIGPVATPTTLYSQSSAGTCVASTAVPSASAHWASAEIVPPSAFVGATTMVVPGAGGLSIVTTVADDGAVERVGLQNAARNETCAPTYLGTEFRCLPDVMQAYAQPGYFTDSACQTPSPAVYLCASKPYVFSNQPLPSVLNACGVAPTGLVFKAFDAVTGLFLSKMGTCAPAAADPAAITSVPGAQIPVADFPVVDTLQRGRARLKTPYLGPTGGPALVRSGGYHYDSTLSAECKMVVIGGRTLCQPATIIPLESFSDPACTVPIYRPPSIANCTTAPPGAVLLASTGQSYKVTNRPYTGGVYAVNGTPLGCHSTGGAQGLPVVELEPVPNDQLVEVRARVE